MRTNNSNAIRLLALRAVSILSFAAVAAFGQQQINLTAGASSLTLPDGTAVPMWGYSCGAAVSGSTATCAKTNPAATGWSPVVITVPTGQDLQINLTNSLPGTVPTSLVIVGQLGGGLGKTATYTASPDHSNAQSNVTWPIAGPAATPGTPPAQGPRVQSFSTEAATGATVQLTWTAPRAGTYLIESGTHPSIQGPMGLYGMLVVTTAPTAASGGTAAAAGTAYPGATYDADVNLLFSEIDPVQNTTVSTVVATPGFSETAVWSGQPGGCGNPSSANYHTCYPPAVNYSPLYYLINGVAFDKTNAAASLFPASATITSPPATGTTTGSVLVRLVNAGLRMHVPSVVGALTGAAPVSGFSLIAEDGNPLPGLPRVQSEVFMAAGKTYDVLINGPAAGTPALAVFDRQLSLSGNATSRDAGMLAYIGINGATVPPAPALAAAAANPDTYNSVVPGQALTVADPSRGVIANDVNVYGVKVVTPPTKGVLTLYANGTFTYVPNSGWTGPDSFVYQANGTGPTATVTLNSAPIEGASGIIVNNLTYTSRVATALSIKSPGILSGAKDAAGYPLSVALTSVSTPSGWTLSVDKSGSFNATVPGPGTYTFTFKAQNSQGTLSASAATVTLVFPTPNGPHVTVVDGMDKTTVLNDYRWIIEEDRTFYVDPTKTTNAGAAGSTSELTFGTNFHTSFMPVVAQGCVGRISCEAGQTVQGVPSVCDGANGICRPGSQKTEVDPSQVYLDPTKRYYISVLPGDAADYLAGSAALGHSHTMGGAPLAPGQTSVTILAEPSPLQTSKLTVQVFEDDNPLNGEQDSGGGVDVLAPNEPGLGGFNITIFDDAGGTGDPTGQVNYDMFNQPLSNSLSGTRDPATGMDACPVSALATSNAAQVGITGMVPVCPKYESDGKTLSPLAGQAVIANMMPGRYGVVATPAADRIARGEEWLQTNTLDGQKAHDSFLKVGEPAFFQEYGPAGYHVSIGFANPKVINGRRPGVCAGTDPNIDVGKGPCNNTVKGSVSTERMSRTPDERLYGSGSYDSFAFTQCYVSLGDPDGEDFAFTKCDGNGNFTLTGIPNGSWRITIFDQWNDLLVDGLSTPVAVSGGTSGTTVDLGQIAINQWQSNIYTRTFFDLNGDGVSADNEPGLALVPTNVRFRDGSFSNFNNTDLNGYANFNEVFPLFSWYVVETDTTRYKNTGTHVVYDAGGPADGTPCGTGGVPPCGSSTIGHFLANTHETVSLPTNLRVPGSVYCDNADCNGFSIANGPSSSASSNLSTGRIDPPWAKTYGWQGFSGQNSFLEFGKKPYAAGENGGIRGHVVYASTRPFDDPALLLQTSWEPLVPHVTINLYQEGTAPDGSQSLTLVDTTQTSSWDDWAQGFRSDGVPNMNCPGQTTADLFFFTLYNQPMYLDVYNNGGTASHTLPNNSQFKCYDGMHNWNQLQPAPYDGMYQFPSVTGMNPASGKPTGTNCSICKPNTAAAPTDWDYGLPMLPAGKYVVEVVVPPGYELVKEEDKNILIGDSFIAPVTVEFPNLGSGVYIIPDQAAVGATYNANNAQNPTTDLGTKNLPRSEGDTGIKESYWPCVGEARIVPDYISLFPGSKEVAPFAGATRNLCDRKEVILGDQTSAQAKFYIFTSTHAAAHFTGVITDDFTSEFDPFSPQFGEKFSPANLPVSVRDFNGNEINRIYSDQWGSYDGLNYSTWEVNPPNPTGYSPTMMVLCMNDRGNGTTPDALFNPNYSQFCYELPFMPGQTGYFDTPVTPTAAFASAGYNNPDCAYPNATPAIKEVDGDGVGPWVSAPGHTLTITALGDQLVNNNAYSGPAATTPPFNQKFITRHYGFGAAKGTVTIGGKNAGIASWSDTQITVTVPGSVPRCALQQQTQYGGPGGSASGAALCGELVVTAANGQQSIDTVTVTVGGKAPTRVTSGTIQAAIDAASPGDLIIVPPGVYKEMLLMWKPVRLQGVGAASSVIDANTQPAGKMDPWRHQVNCLFGLSLNGQPYSGQNPYDPSGTLSCPGTGWTYFTAAPQNPQVDRLPLEGVLGWDTTVNGNLAQLLQEPTLMGAYEGAAVTVLSKGVNTHGAAGYYGSGAESAFPAGTTVLTSADCTTSRTNQTNPFPSNFQCNPSRIDGLGITDSSQGGGGIFVHAWGHNLEIANNRVYNNTGTLTGGITVGQGESPDAYLAGTPADSDPGSCQTSNVANAQLPYCFDLNVNVHNNSVTLNSSIGDELFSATPAGAGGVTFCTGADYYQFRYNWVCGNLSTGDGGGVVHIGFIYNGDIEHNWILFNQSTNPTVPANGGGLIVMGAPPDGTPPGAPAGTECGGTVADADCTPGLSDGTGPNLLINANLFLGNAAESGSGGGIRFQNVNGTEVATFPKTPTQWNSANVTNNIIVNNVAGWDGAGIALQDALAVNIVNNTIASNTTTASSGVLFNTLGAPLSSSPGGGNQTSTTTTSAPQPAGLVAIGHSPQLLTSLVGVTLTCPTNHPNCASISYPYLANDVFWQNSTYYIGVGALSAAYQQNVVTLYNSFTTTPAPSQPSTDATSGNGGGVIITGGTGACVAASYWDIGVRGDTGPANHGSGFTLAPTYSVLTDAADYPSGHNFASNPTFVSQYCNGSRVPPEFGGSGWQVPPGISDATVPNPIFSLQPAATVDEGNNWINLSWGPLALVGPSGNTLGNYALATGSPAIDAIPNTSPTFAQAPSTDYFGNPRPDPGSPKGIDVGAVEFQGAGAGRSATVTGGPLAFGNVAVGQTSTSKTLTLNNTGTGALTGITLAFSSPRFSRPAGTAGGTCGTTLATGATCTINVVFSPTATGLVTATLTITSNISITGSPVTLTGTGVAPVVSAALTPATWSPTQARNCPGTTLAQIAACALDPAQIFTLTNTGNVPLTGITQGTLSGTNVADFAVARALSTCGPAGNGQLTGLTTLAPGATCAVTVQFKPLTSEPAGTKTATLSVTDLAGTQTSALTGTAQ